MSEQPVRAVWTDFGGVVTPAMSHTWGAFCAQLGVNPDILLDTVIRVSAGYGTKDFMEPLDTPMVSEREWLAQIGTILEAEHGYSVHLESLGPIWFNERETNQGWVDRLLAAKRDDVFVGMLSNMVPAWDPYWRKLVPVGEMFDDLVLSFEVGCRKPEAAIFELAAGRAGVDPGECVLIDDLAVNCAGAIAAGWQAIHFTDTDKAVAELDAMLGVAVAL